MIKASLFNTNESFFSQSILLLFPILLFSASFEFALLIGSFAFLLIYLMTLVFVKLAPYLEKKYLFPLLLGLSLLSGLMVSSCSFYLYPEQFASYGYLINLFFISLLNWQKNILTSRNTSIEKINEEILPSLFWVLLALWLSALLRELVGTGSLVFLGTSFSLLPKAFTLPMLQEMVGSFLALFLSAFLLKLSPENYISSSISTSMKETLTPRSLKTLEQTIAERTSRLERLLDEKHPSSKN